MIRFIDLTKEYWTDPDEGSPVCAFLSTDDDRFIETIDGAHTFGWQEEVNEHPDSHRLRGLMPDNFFAPKTMWQCIGCRIKYRTIPTRMYEDGHGGRPVNNCCCGCDMFVEVKA